MPKIAFQSPNRQRTYPKYGSELEARIPKQEISLQLKPSSVHDAYSHNMLSNNSKDLETGYREPEAESHSKDLAAFSESIHENRLQEDHANGHPIHDTYKTKDNGKGSKRKAWEMERKAAAVEIQARKKVEQDSRIVRVSRVTGGKDRHSKVLTEKGLRDRRVRLSIPTAIQLYDLQDRLGLEQPSKAVDWLIQAAKSALDALTVLDTEMASASAGNVAQLTSSDCSNAEHCAGSPRESATATAASALSTFGVCQGTNSHKVTSGKVTSITTMKESDLGRSSSSTSDGSIKGSAIHTSSCSMSKPVSRMEARLKARLKAKERASKKSSSAKTSVGSLPAIHQLKSMQPSLTSLFNDVFPYNTLPLESQCSKDDNPCGIRPQVMSRTSSVQQLLDYNSTPSYADMLCTQDSLPFQNMASSLAVALQKSFPPVPNTLASMQAVIGSSILQSYEMIDSAFPFFPPKQSGHLESNAAQDQGNLFSNIPNMIMKSVERQQQQQAQMHSKHFASTIVPTFSNDINFSTSSLSSREPLQSNSSSTTNMPSFSHTQKNTYGVASAKSGYDFVPLEDYNVRAFQESHNVQDNVNHEHNHPWAKEKHHR